MRTSPSGPISADAIIAVSTYSSWSSKFCSTELVSTRSSAAPPPISNIMIHAAAVRIMRRVSEPVLWNWLRHDGAFAAVFMAAGGFS